MQRGFTRRKLIYFNNPLKNCYFSLLVFFIAVISQYYSKRLKDQLHTATRNNNHKIKIKIGISV